MARARLNKPVLLLAIIAALYCGAVLALPLFPSQDGPVHLYFVQVLRALIFHVDPGLYPNFYVVKHVLPPYALYYYLLMLLAEVLPIVLADKLIVCLYIVLFLFGFHFLAQSLGPRADSMSLLISPLVLNWPLAMGFVSFSLSLALSMFALGLWSRLTASPPHQPMLARSAGFVLLCFLVMLTHPVPLLLILAFAALDLLVRTVRRSHAATQARRLSFEFITLCLGATTLLYLRAFTAEHVLRQTSTGGSYLAGLAANTPSLILLHTLLPFAGATPIDLIYRTTIVGILVLAFAQARRDLRQALRKRSWTPANTWFVCAIGLGVTLPFVPSDLNHSHFFAGRLVVVLWIAMLAGACGSPQLGQETTNSKPLATLAAIVAVLLTGLVLLLGKQRIGPLARQIAESETAPLAMSHYVVLMLNDESYTSPHTLNFDPYRWSGLRFIRRSQSVLYNTPWLDLPVMPLGAPAGMPTSFVDPVSLEFAPYMRRDLNQSAQLRARIFSNVDLLLTNHGTSAPEKTRDPILTLDPVVGDSWTCVPEAFYSLCIRKP